MPLDPSQFAARLGLALTAGLVFIIFALAGMHFFRRPLFGQGIRFRLHQAGSLFFGLVHLAAAAMAPLASSHAVLIAIGLYLAGIALFLWAQETVKQTPPYLAFSGVAPERLFVDGPYRFVRHPFYLAFIAVIFAVPVATLNPWLLASAFIMTINYVAAAFEEEAAFARTPYAERHRVYACQTGMFAPRPRALAPVVRESRLSPVVVGAILLSVLLAVLLLVDILSL